MSTISSNEQCFNEQKEDFQKAIDDAGYDYMLTYEKGKGKRPKVYCGKWKQHSDGKVSNNKVIWFNPPFNL